MNNINSQKENLAISNFQLQTEIKHLKEKIDFLKSEEMKIKEDVERLSSEKQTLENKNIELFESVKIKFNPV